ncbi:MAG: TonB-dependent receptor plug domain-containing protein, partial [Nitrospiria bacterium]
MNQRTFRKFSRIFFFMFLLPRLAFAAEPPSDFQDILAVFAEEKVVVTPSRYPQSVGQSPSTITVITAEEIHASGAITLPDILRWVPGMEVMQMTSTDLNVSIRGNNQLLANKLLILINGRTFQEEVQNTAMWAAFPVSLEEIDRIEIVRGPGSAVWGANAFDGVVNIITKSPRSGDKTFFSGRIGEQGTAVGDLYHAHSGDKLDVNISFGYQQTDALGLAGDGLEVSRGNTIIKYHLTSNKTIGLSAGTSSAPKYEGPLFDDGLSNSDVDLSYIQLDYKTSRSSLLAYWNSFDIDLNYSIFKFLPFVAPGPLNASHDLYNVEGQHNVPFGRSQQIITGFQYRVNNVQGGPLLFDNKNRLQSLGFYFQDEWRPSSQLTVVFGGRYDFNDVIEDIFNPRGSLIYHFPEGKQSLRFSASTAYRSPTPLELFEAGGGGNVNLAPERITSYEVVYNTFLFEKFRGEATLFYNRLSNLINVEKSPNTNLHHAEIYGTEIGGEFLVNPWLTFFANYAHQKIKTVNLVSLLDDSSREGPEHKINSGIKVRHKG